MRATDDVLAGEHSPLLKETASGDKIRARVDGVSTSATTFNTKTGLFALGAVAVCGVLALANGPAWRYAASSSSSIASAPTTAAIGKGHHVEHAAGSLSAGSLSALSKEEAGTCDASSMAHAAQSKGVFTYSPPATCDLMVVCAGSPRAASTAHCMIAEHIISSVMDAVKAAKKSISSDEYVYAGYWNYHLHAVCSDGKECPLFDGKDGSFDEFKNHIFSIPGLSGEEKKGLDDSMDDVKMSMEHLSSEEAKKVVIVKSHEYDATLMSSCAKRIILTSWREKEDVFDSGLELGWFAEPKEQSREDFERVYDVWSGWHKCWAHNSAADDSTQNHDLGFEALSTKDTFKDEVGKLTKMVCTSFGIPETEIDLDAIVESVTKDDFHEELNPMLSNGNQKATLVATATATTGAREKVKWRLMGNH